MSLGNYVRVLRTFVDAFTAAVQPVSSTNGTVKRTSNEEPELSTETETEGSPEILKLMSDLKVFYPLVKIALGSNINTSEISKQTQQIWP
jgi:hypothetical protein